MQLKCSTQLVPTFLSLRLCLPMSGWQYDDYDPDDDINDDDVENDDVVENYDDVDNADDTGGIILNSHFRRLLDHLAKVNGLAKL